MERVERLESGDRIARRAEAFPRRRLQDWRDRKVHRYFGSRRVLRAGLGTLEGIATLAAVPRRGVVGGAIAAASRTASGAAAM